LPITADRAILETMKPWKASQASLRQAPGGEAAATSFLSASWWSTILSAALIVLSGVAAYHNSFSKPFVHDDVYAIVQNQSIRQLWPVSPIFSPPSRGETVSGRPLLNLSLAMNYAVGGLDVWGYHAANLAIHIAAALLLFGIVRRTLLMPVLSHRFGSPASWLALASALLWTVHPLHTESVTYIIQRAESLASFFYLLTLYCVIRGAGAGTVPFFSWSAGLWPAQADAGETPALHEQGKKGDCPPRPQIAWYAAAVLACLLGMATKEIVATAPLIVLLYDRMFLAGSFTQAWRRRWGLYLGLAATWGLLGYLVLSTGLMGRQAEIGAPDAWSYACSEPGVLVHYLWLCVWPHPLCFHYGWPVANAPGEVLFGVIPIAIVLAATIWGLIRRKAWGFLGTWFLLILAPTSSILPLSDLAYEHRMYLPLAAVAVLAVAGGYVLWDRLLPRPADRGYGATVVRWAAPMVVLAAVVVALGSTTEVRNRDYRSSVVLWQDTVDKRPHNFFAHNRLGNALASSGRFHEAIAHYHETLRLKPDFARARINLGNALLKIGKTRQAMDQYLQVLQCEPSNAAAHGNLGVVLAAVGRTDEAIAHCREALRLRPEDADAHYNLGLALAKGGRMDEAIEHYHQALRLKPEHAAVHFNLGNALAGLGKTGEAIAHYNQCLQRMPDRRDALNNLAWLLATQETAAGGDSARAVQLAERACEGGAQENAECLDTLAAAYAAAGRFADAILTAQRAERLAESAGQTRLAASIQTRLELYRAARPYREIPGTPRQTTK